MVTRSCGECGVAFPPLNRKLCKAHLGGGRQERGGGRGGEKVWSQDPVVSVGLLFLHLTENYAKHTFQAPCCCFENVLMKDLLLVETISVSIDQVVIKSLIQ